MSFATTMSPYSRHITLEHLVVDGSRKIGLKFFPDKVIQALVKELPSPKWSGRHHMPFVDYSRKNLDLIFEKFRGVAWVNGKHFF